MSSLHALIGTSFITNTTTSIASRAISSSPSCYDFSRLGRNNPIIWNENNLYRTVLQGEIQDDSDTLRKLAIRLLVIKNLFEDVNRWANVILLDVPFQPNILTYKAEREDFQGRFREKEIEWLQKNSYKYQGKWVIVEGDKLIGVGNDPNLLRSKARKKGVNIPFLVFVPPKHEESFMGL